MSALYRQARPSTFDEMVGQGHVKEVLLSAITQGKLAQAYLFSGPRGVGKTSSARLVAQAVNCLHTPRPCGQCEGCRLVREARHPDVLEIDAASNNSVEDVRDLRDKILLSPLLSQHKVVILDEAHMMSKSAFNALLKTLEEPPPHVIFIFATTEPERLPPTILSRTQHFRFKRLTEGQIVEKLQRIVQNLDRPAEPAALQLLARLADGAMRDAESLLDRLLTLEGPLTLERAEASLGLAPQQALWELAQTLDAGRVRPAVETAQTLYTQGFAARSLAQGLLEAFRAGLYARMGLGEGPSLEAAEDRLVAAMTAIDQALERLLRRSDFLALELVLLGAYQALHLAAPNPAEAQPSTPAGRPVPSFDPAPGRTPAPAPIRSSAPASSAPQTNLAEQWRMVINALKMTVRGFVREASPHLDPPHLDLVFPERASFHHSNAQKHLEAIQTTVRELMGDYTVRLILQGEKKSPDPQPAPPPPVRTPTSVEVVTPRPPPQPPVQPEEEEAPWPQSDPFAATSDPAPPPEAARSDQGSTLLDNPRLQNLIKTLGARVRKVQLEPTRVAQEEAEDILPETEPADD